MAQRLGLEQLAEAEVDKGQEGSASQDSERKRRRKVQKLYRRQARFVLKTLGSFLSSDSQHVEERHVFYKALEQKTFLPKLYIEKAQQAFKMMCDPNDLGWPQTHDGYLKLFQLQRGLNLGPQAPAPECCGGAMIPRNGRHGVFFKCGDCEKKANAADVLGFDVIIIDEAQDFTPCQADAFFRQAEHGARVYLVGDPRQRMYRWRGARDSFEKQDVGDLQFSLTLYPPLELFFLFLFI